MSCEAGNESCAQESPGFGHSEVGDQCNNLVNNSQQQIVGGDIGRPLGKGLGCDVETTGVINPGPDKNVYEDPVLVVTPEWQRRSWLLEVSQSAEDNPESVMSVNSENESDGGSWTFEDGPEGNLKAYELQIRNMTSISEALKAKARKAEKELSDNDKAFKKQLDDANYTHAESMQAQQDQWDIERAEAQKSRKGLLRDYDHLTVRYRAACVQIKDQIEKINDLDAKLSECVGVLNQAKAPDGSIHTHKQRQKIVEDLRRDAEALEEFYKNRIKTLQHQVARKVARLDKSANESRDLQHKLQTLGTELSNEQQKYRDVEARLKLERKSHVDTEETSKRNFESRVREAQTTVEHRDEQIQQMDNIIRSLQAHLMAAQQSYAAAMGTAENLHRAHEKLSEENRELVAQHHYDMEHIVIDHQSVCDSYSKTEAVLREEIATLKERLGLMGDSCSCDWSQWKATANAMQQEILDLRADLLMAKDTSMRDEKNIDAQLPGKTPKKEVGNWKSEALDALAEAVARVDDRRLDKGKGIADDIAEKRSREAAKSLAGLPGSEFSKLQAMFRKGMAEAEIDQGVKSKPTPVAVHSNQPTQPSEPKPTPVAAHSDKPAQPLKPRPTPVAAHSDKPTQPSKPRPASAPAHSAGQPPKPSTISKIPTPAKAQPEDQLKETPPVAAQPASSRSFSIHCETSYWTKPQSEHVKVTDEVAVSSADIERSRPIPIPIAEEQKSAAPGNQA